MTNRFTVVLRNAISNILCSDPANDPNYPPVSCIQSIIETYSYAVFELCSGVFDTIWALLADEAEFWFYIIWLMKTIDNVPYFLSPKSTVHSSTTAKFSTRIRLNLVGFQTFARRARTRVHCKTKFSMRGSGDGQSPDRHRIIRGYVHGHAFWQPPESQTSR